MYVFYWISKFYIFIILFLILITMYRTNSSQVEDSRGRSVGGKLFNMTNLRHFQPKFLSSLNSTENMNGKIKTQDVEVQKVGLRKQNIPPPVVHPPQKKTAIKQTNNITIGRSEEKKQQVISLSYSAIRGLYNIGNTCYLNSTLQCLFHLPKFNTSYLKQMKVFTKRKIEAAAQYQDIIEQLIDSDSSKPINVASFKKSIGRKKPRFLGNAQQDAQEFLTSFLEVINEELTRITQKPQYKELEGNLNIKPLIEISQEWWDYYLKRDNSIICDFFQAQVLSTVQCKKCKNKSLTFDNIWGLPITLSRGKTVPQLIERYWKAQSLIEDYHCSKCKKLIDCSRTLEFFRLPQVLVVQLKRFEYGKYSKRKIKDEIKIQKEIDMGPFLNKQAKKINTGNSTYKLSGMIHHLGQTDFGHYKATVFDHKRKNWYQMNDAMTEQCSSPSSSTQTGYILFYEKQ